MYVCNTDVQCSSQIVTTNIPTPNVWQAGCPSCHPTNSVEALKGDVSDRVMEQEMVCMSACDKHEQSSLLICTKQWFSCLRVCAYTVKSSRPSVALTGHHVLGMFTAHHTWSCSTSPSRCFNSDCKLSINDAAPFVCRSESYRDMRFPLTAAIISILSASSDCD